MPLERFSAAWREAYVESVSGDEERVDGCVFCRLAEEAVDEATGVLERRAHSYVVLNAFPYGSGHVLVVPYRHAETLEELTADESSELWGTVTAVSRALRSAYRPDGLNVGFNLGHAAGAGIPRHLHAHLLPRWDGDTNFMTTIAETRVLPESLASTWRKVRAALPPGLAGEPSVDFGR
ncbi:MAG TPA: HIT domain-containing protein [Acidimicrobiales bacterium]|nr:MAG: hypothetical protein B7Z69_03290 [Actinobacteria bacterium 21-73-9]HQU25641.1 HIT domain-containing protein [Acidimicrobiales bacterium]